ncbi:MAG: hypothetical protein JW925_02930 [Syntrophaceae bacterium]|nr:hypothetical protein [Syntrophaceae bacterium]
MKYIVTGIAVLVLLVAACSFMGQAQQPMPGGYTTTEVTSNDVIRAASFAIKAQEKASGKTSKLVLVKILEAESQVVAGINYRLKLKVRLNGKEKTAEVIVWWQAWRKPDPYQLRSWNWK